MTAREHATITCPRCDLVVPRLVSLPFPAPFLLRQGVQGAVCESCLAELEREYSEDRDFTRPVPGPAAIEEPAMAETPPDDREDEQ